MSLLWEKFFESVRESGVTEIEGYMPVVCVSVPITRSAYGFDIDLTKTCYAVWAEELGDSEERAIMQKVLDSYSLDRPDESEIV